MNAAWFVARCRAAALTLAEIGDYTASVALETLAEDIETESARLREAQYASAQAPEPEIGGLE
jgi:hypothetical protein